MAAMFVYGNRIFAPEQVSGGKSDERDKRSICLNQ
jgi:hypothetical protein